MLCSHRSVEGGGALGASTPTAGGAANNISNGLRLTLDLFQHYGQRFGPRETCVFATLSQIVLYCSVLSLNSSSTGQVIGIVSSDVNA